MTVEEALAEAAEARHELDRALAAVEVAYQRRTDVMRRLRGSYSLRTVGALFGVSHVQVAKLCGERKAIPEL